MVGREKKKKTSPPTRTKKEKINPQKKKTTNRDEADRKKGERTAFSATGKEGKKTKTREKEDAHSSVTRGERGGKKKKKGRCHDPNGEKKQKSKREEG